MLFGLATRRQVILPSWKGWLLLLILAALGMFVFIQGAYPFLAAHDRLPEADVLIVEGWVSDRTLAEAKREFDAGRGALICTVGVDLERGQRLLPWKDWAHVAAETLASMAVPREKLLIVPGGSQQRHRTYVSLRQAREVLARLPQPPRKINLITEAHHGRRSGMVARKVFGDFATTGVISVAPESYDPKRWWASSTGTKNMLLELMASAHEFLFDSGR